VADEVSRTILELLDRHMVREQAEDIPGILDTLVPEPRFVMEYLPFNISNRWWWSRKDWRGRDAVAAFYRGLFAFFRGFQVTLLRYTLSAKGVVDVSRIRGRIFSSLLNLPALGLRGIPVSVTVVAFFEYDPGARKFCGERVFMTERNALKNL